MSSKPAVTSPWKAYTVESTGKKYWYNKETKAKSWTDPNPASKPTTKVAGPTPKVSTGADGTVKPVASPDAITKSKENTKAVPAASTVPATKSTGSEISAAPAPTKDAGTKVPPDAAGSAWKLYTLNSGQKYWYNKLTKEKTWKDPNVPPTAAVKASAAVPSKATRVSNDYAADSSTAVSATNPASKPPTSKDVKAPKANERATVPPKIVGTGKDQTTKASVVAPQTTAASNPPASEDVKNPSAKPNEVVAKTVGNTISAASSKAAATATQSSPAPAAPQASKSLPANQASAKNAGGSRELKGVDNANAAALDDHVTVEVKSTKKNWRGALDVGLKVLDAALDRAKKGEDLEDSAGHAPIVKGPVAKEAVKSVVAESSKGGPGDKNSASALKHTPAAHASVSRTAMVPEANWAAQHDTKEKRPKAHSKMSWKSPFKKHAADTLPVEHDLSRGFDSDTELKSNHHPAADQAQQTIGMAAASGSQYAGGGQPDQSRAAATHSGEDKHKYNEPTSSGDIQDGRIMQMPQKSLPGKGAAAAGAFGGAATGAAGYSAYTEHEQRGVTDVESSPPSRLSRPEDDSDFGPPSPPLDDEDDNNSGPPSPPLDDEDDDDNSSGPPKSPLDREDVWTSSPPETNDDSLPPSPPNEEDFEGQPDIVARRDDDSTPPAPAHVEEDEEGGDDDDDDDVGIATGPPSPPSDDQEVDASAPPSHPQSDTEEHENDNNDFTTYAFEQPPSPVDSNPPTPPVQEYPSDDEGAAAPSPTQSPSPPASPSPTHVASPAPSSQPSRTASPARSAGSKDDNDSD